MRDMIYVINQPDFNSLQVNFPRDRFETYPGTMDFFPSGRVDFELEFSASTYEVSENINKELLDFGLVNQMTVNQLFKEINKKLDKRK